MRGQNVSRVADCVLQEIEINQAATTTTKKCHAQIDRKCTHWCFGSIDWAYVIFACYHSRLAIGSPNSGFFGNAFDVLAGRIHWSCAPNACGVVSFGRWPLYRPPRRPPLQWTLVSARTWTAPWVADSYSRQHSAESFDAAYSDSRTMNSLERVWHSVCWFYHA